MKGLPRLPQLIFVLAGLMLLAIWLSKVLAPEWKPWLDGIQIVISLVQMVAGGVLAYHADQRGPYTHT